MTMAAAPLLPRISTASDYTSSLLQPHLWRTAMLEVLSREGLYTRAAPRSLPVGLYPAAAFGSELVVKLYGPWEDGPIALADEVAAYQLAALDTELPVPRLVAHGALNDEWSYVVTTFLPGTPLSSARAAARDDLTRLAEWLGDFVRRLHALPLPAPTRVRGWDRWADLISARYQSISGRLRETGLLPERLAAEIPGWLPQLDELLPSPDAGVLLHADLHDGHILGEIVSGRFMPTGVIDFNRSQIGHPYYEVAAPGRWVFHGDPRLNRRFIESAGLPSTGTVDSSRLALAYTLLHGADQLSDLPPMEGARSLDDLAVGLFGAQT